MALSCELHTAKLYDRGGQHLLGALDPLALVRWERRRDDTSTGMVKIAVATKECAGMIGLAEAGRSELVIFRGKKRVWEGPVTHIQYQGDSIEIQARDVTHYLNRTIMRNEYDNRYPYTGKVLDRLKRILDAEVARKEALDPPVNLLAHVQYMYEAGSTTYERAYYAVGDIRSAVSAAKTLNAIRAAVTAISSSYGISAKLEIPATTSTSGASWKIAKIQDWQLKQYVNATLDVLAMYPPSFIAAAGVEGINYVRALVSTPADQGVFAAATKMYVDIDKYVTGSNALGATFTLHHGLNHLIRNTFGDALIKARWLALNPSGFAYTSDWQNPSYTLNPPGFIRGYSRSSFEEDFADVAAAVFDKATQTLLASITAADAVVAAKVALFKEWMAAVSGNAIVTDNYYKAIHTKTIVTPGVNGVTDARTAAHTVPYETTVFAHVDNFASRGGLDYTVVGRSIIFSDVHQKLGQTATVTADDFIGDPIITQYGMELATYVAMTDGKGNWGEAGGVDPYYGEWELLHQAYDETAPNANEEDIPTVAELTSQAERTYAQGKRPPVVVRIPDGTQLNPNGVLEVSDLVPGVHIPLSANLPGRTVSQMQKLDSMSVEESPDGEIIKVTLSPAPVEQTFVED